MMEQRPQREDMTDRAAGVDFPMYHVYKPRRGMKRGEESKETYKLPHRLIEKKRRDRINECISQLKDLLPEHLKLTTLGHLEKAVVLELTLKHVTGLTSLLEQQQQKILALQSGMKIDQPPAVSQETTEQMFRSGFHLCAKEVLSFLSRSGPDGGSLVDHIQALAQEVLQGPARARSPPLSPLVVPAPPRTPSLSPPAAGTPQHDQEEEEVEVSARSHSHHHHHNHHHHHHSLHTAHKDKPTALLTTPPKPSAGDAYGSPNGRNCVPVIQRAYAPVGGAGEQSGSDTDTDSGYGGEQPVTTVTAQHGDHAHYYYGHAHYGQERASDWLKRGGSSSHYKQEVGSGDGAEPRHKRPRRAESSESSDESLSGGESSSCSSSSSSSQRPYMGMSPSPHPPLCVPFYLLPPSYLPMLEKVWYHPGPTGGAVLYPGGMAPAPAPHRSPSPGEGGSPPPPPPPMDSPALLQALQQHQPINPETND